MKFRDLDGQFKDIVIKTGDTLPVGSVVEYEGSTPPAGWSKLSDGGSVIVSSEEPTTGEEVWLQKGKNLIDKNLLIFGMELDGNGGTIARSNYYITPFIEIESNTIYTFKGAKSLKGVDNYYTDYYDKDYNFISSNEFSTFTTPSNAKYVRFNGCSDFSIDLQLEKGEKIIPKKIHTKTDNGYEEFYSEEDTGWIILTVPSDVSGNSGQTLKIRKKNGIVNIVGNVKIVGSSWNKKIIELPLEFKPAQEINFVCRGLDSEGDAHIITISDAGRIGYLAGVNKSTSGQTFTVALFATYIQG